MSAVRRASKYESGRLKQPRGDEVERVAVEPHRRAREDPPLEER